MRKSFSIIVFFFILPSLISCISTGTLNIEDTQQERNSTIYINTYGDNLFLYNDIKEVCESAGFKVEFITSIKDIPDVTTQETSGTGFFFAPNYILTNAHVVNDSDIVTYIKNGKSLTAKVVFKNIQNDIAVLWTENPSGFYFDFADSYKVSDSIFVLGYPLYNILGTEIRVTNGIINSLSGINGDTNVIQISAQIQPGNSGGPTINSLYKVVGIASSKLSDQYMFAKNKTIAQNVNFAIKADIVNLFIKEYKNISNTKYVSNLSEATDSTVLIFADGENVLQDKEYVYYLDYQYNASWDVFHYTATYMSMICVDFSTGENIASYNSSYFTASSIETIAKRQSEEIISQLFEYEKNNNL